MNSIKNFLLILIIQVVIFTNTNVAFAACSNSAGGNIQYEMVSYENNTNSQGTPLFDLQVFNKPCFELSNQSIGSGIQFVFDLLIGASIALAVILFTVGAAEGIILSAGISEKLKGKEKMENAIIGLIMILSIWLIINTVNPDLLRQPIYSGLESLGSVTKVVETGSSSVTSESGEGAGPGSVSGSGNEGTSGGGGGGGGGGGF